MTLTATKALETSAKPPLRPVLLGPADVVVERRGDGAIVLRSPHPLPAFPQKLTERLVHWAKAAPERVFLAQRDASGAWRTLTYADALTKVRAIAATLLARGLSPELPIAVLSGNDIEHALIGLAAMHVGIPYAPISVPYSLLSKDFGKLKTIIEVLLPGLVFAAGLGQRNRVHDRHRHWLHYVNRSGNSQAAVRAIFTLPRACCFRFCTSAVEARNPPKIPPARKSGPSARQT